MLLSYELLQIIWFILWGLLWAIYFGLDGFDLGSGMLVGLFRGKEDSRLLIGSLAPVWDGNEVWVITAGGVTFAAFPIIYAVMFSSLYLPLILILLGLVLRAVAIEFYHHMNYDPKWQRLWEIVLPIASFVVAFLFGVAFGNLFAGLPFDANGWHGNILSLLNPYGLLTGALFVVAFLFNGANWMAHKSADEGLHEKALNFANKCWIALLVIGVAWYAYTPFATPLLGNYLAIPVLLIVPVAAVVCLLMAKVVLAKRRPLASLVYGSLTVFFTALFGVIGLFPNMLMSAMDPSVSLTAFNSSSSHYTLNLMLIVTVLFLPLVLAYQAYAYRLFGKAKTGSEAGDY